MANILAYLHNFKLFHTIVSITVVYSYIFTGVALSYNSKLCYSFLQQQRDKVLESRKQEWGTHVETIEKCVPPASQRPFNHVTPKRAGWRVLTSLAMSREALALLMEMASALRS